MRRRTIDYEAQDDLRNAYSTIQETLDQLSPVENEPAGLDITEQIRSARGALEEAMQMLEQEADERWLTL